MMELQERIIQAAMEEFNLHGIKFTMDQVAKKISISKKTIYTIFEDKKQLIIEMIESGFHNVKEAEQRILMDQSLDTVEKLSKVIIVIPEEYSKIDFSKLYELKEKYPKLYQEVEKRIESDWEPTLQLFETGIAEGKIRPINPIIFKGIISGAMEEFISRDTLKKNQIAYQEALEEMISIIMNGIVIDKRG
ncbi:MAG: TetR/AcrR family transcriptional regulator [Lachnospiraceae bacterium]|nr:TetR/AcrR family transcriptional regulator [Lachnospiraceae bacterium]